MKRTNTIILLCALLLSTGCSKETSREQQQPESGVPMRFEVSALQSRGVPISHVDSMRTMGIFGYSTGTDLFDPDEPTHTPNLLYDQLATRASHEVAWEYDPVVFWPMDITVNNTFFAYAPHSSEFDQETNLTFSADDASDYPTLTYTIPEDVTKQVDILYAAPSNATQNINRETNGAKVLYQMKHTMFWLGFMVNATTNELVNGQPDPLEEYRLTWLALMGHDMPVTATLNLATGEWEEPDIDEDPDAFEDRVYEFNINEEKAGSIKPTVNPVVRVVDDDSYLILFPFTIDSEVAEATIDVTFDYTNTAMGAGNYIEYYYYMPLPTIAFIEPGMVLVYILNLSPEGVTVEFGEQHTIEEWFSEEDLGNQEIF